MIGGHRPIQSHEDDDIHGLGHSDFRGLGGILGSGNDTSHDQVSFLFFSFLLFIHDFE